MDFVKWFIEEHPYLFFFGMWFASTAIGNLGRIGSTSVRVKLPKNETSGD